MKSLLIDINKCNGCYNCQVACKDEHVGNDWSPIAAPQPDTGHFWMKVTDVVQGTVPKVRVRYMLDTCQQCDDAPCMAACASKAVYKRDDGIVIIDPEKCNGSGACLKACPYGVIYLNDESNIAQKCTMCAHLLDSGWKEPRCVDACPTGALTFGEEAELQDLMAGAEVLHPEYGTKPRVRYIGLLNKYWVAGAVFDPDADEVLEGATVTLTGAGGGAVVATSDAFGDFWFERQAPGSYTLTVEMPGYAPASVGGFAVEKDLNIGDLELRRTQRLSIGI